MKKMLLATILIVTATSPAASTLGIIPYETSKTSQDLQESFKFGLINPGNQKLNITISAEKSENYNVSIQEPEFVLNPSKSSQTPLESDNYFNGQKYFQVVKKNLTINAKERRTTNDIDFTINVRATPYSNPDGYSGPTISQLREIKYELDIDKILIKGLDQEAEENNERKTEEVEKPVQTERKQNQSQESSNQTQGKSIPQEDSKNKISLLLIAGIILTGMYIYKVL